MFCALVLACGIFSYIQNRKIESKINTFDSNSFISQQVLPHTNATTSNLREIQSTSAGFSYNYSVTTRYMKSSLWCGNSLFVASDAMCNTTVFESKPRIIVAIDDTSWPANEFNLGAYNCPHIQCNFILNSEIQTGGYDAYLTGSPPRKKVPKKTTAIQKNIEIMMESSVNYPELKNVQSYYKMNIDLVIAYRQHTIGISWLPTSYINTELNSFLTQNSLVNTWNARNGRMMAMAAFVTNCKKTVPDRLHLLQNIAREFPVLKFGSCFAKTDQALPHKIDTCKKYPRRSPMWDAPKECVMHGVLFAFALENSIEPGYISEKLWQPLKMGAIPIYSVVGARENRDFFPHPDAVLVIEDFGSIHALTEYMHKIANNESLWYKHAMAWRRLPLQQISPMFLNSVSNSLVTLPCRLCELLHTNKRNTSHSHDFIQDSVLQSQLEPNAETTYLRRCVLSEFEKVWNAWPLRNVLPSPNSKEILGFDVIFIIHYSPLKHRKPMMQTRIRDAFIRDGIEIPVVWIDVFDREMLAPSFLDQCAKTATVRKYQKIMNNPHRENYLGEDSLTLKHLFAAYSLLRTPSGTSALILEDDATFDESGIRRSWTASDGVYQQILRDLPEDYDILMLSRFDPNDEALKHKPRIGKHLVHAQASRVASAYLLSQKGALNLLRSLPIIGPMDFQIDYACSKEARANARGVPVPLSLYHDIKVFHSKPWLSDQLDTTGKTRSVVDT